MKIFCVLVKYFPYCTLTRAISIIYIYIYTLFPAGTMSSPVHSTHGSEVQSLKHPQVASLTAPHIRTSDEDHMTQLRTMSPASWQSSPGTTPPTSPALTPRGTRFAIYIMITWGKVKLCRPSAKVFQFEDLLILHFVVREI